MPGIGHLAVGLAAARVTTSPAGFGRWRWTMLLAAVSFAPDLDVLGFLLGVPYDAPFGHRGALHSLTFAALTGCALALAARASDLPALRILCSTSLVMASHGILDAFTDGGRGVALLWPFTDARYFAPWRPIPVSPIGPAVFSGRGLHVIFYEAVLFSPLLVVAFWPRAVRSTRSQSSCRD
jgi:inner membrane protein